MIPRGRGKIVNIASAPSELARAKIAPYGATKGAVKMLTKGMAADWARHGLQVNAIGPGYFRTELNAALVADPDFTAWLEKRTPAGRWAELAELVGAAVFLASDASSFVNGHMLYVDGGTACLARSERLAPASPVGHSRAPDAGRRGRAWTQTSGWSASGPWARRWR